MDWPWHTKKWHSNQARKHMRLARDARGRAINYSPRTQAVQKLGALATAHEHLDWADYHNQRAGR